MNIGPTARAASRSAASSVAAIAVNRFALHSRGAGRPRAAYMPRSFAACSAYWGGSIWLGFQASRAGLPTAGLDALVAFAPWQSDAARDRYLRARRAQSFPRLDLMIGLLVVPELQTGPEIDVQFTPDRLTERGGERSWTIGRRPANSPSKGTDGEAATGKTTRKGARRAASAQGPISLSPVSIRVRTRSSSHGSWGFHQEGFSSRLSNRLEPATSTTRLCFRTLKSQNLVRPFRTSSRLDQLFVMQRWLAVSHPSISRCEREIRPCRSRARCVSWHSLFATRSQPTGAIPLPLLKLLRPDTCWLEKRPSTRWSSRYSR